jgi:hypothetical protein
MAALDVHLPLPRDPARLKSPLTSPKAVAAPGAMEAAAAARSEPSSGKAITKVTSVDIMGLGAWEGDDDNGDVDDSPVKKPTEAPTDPALEVMKLRQQVGHPHCAAHALSAASRACTCSCRAGGLREGCVMAMR